MRWRQLVEARIGGIIALHAMLTEKTWRSGHAGKVGCPPAIAYPEALILAFPAPTLRLAAWGERRAEREYLGLLTLALDHGLEQIEPLLAGGDPLTLESVRTQLGIILEPQENRIIPVDFRAELDQYDALLSEELQNAPAPAQEVAHVC